MVPRAGRPLAAHPARVQFWISTSQIISLMPASSCALFIRRRLKARPAPTSEARPLTDEACEAGPAAPRAESGE